MSVENRAAVLANRGFPCCVRFPLQVHAVAITPADSLRASLFSLRDLRPSLKFSQVGFRIALFEACSAFTTRYGLHLRQVAFTRPSTPKASADSLPPLLLRLLPAGATVAGWVSHPLKIAAFSRRTELFGLEQTAQDVVQYAAVPVVEHFIGSVNTDYCFKNPLRAVLGSHPDSQSLSRNQLLFQPRHVKALKAR